MGKEAVGSWAGRWERYLCEARCNGQLLTPVRAVPVTTKKDQTETEKSRPKARKGREGKVGPFTFPESERQVSTDPQRPEVKTCFRWELRLQGGQRSACGHLSTKG